MRGRSTRSRRGCCSSWPGGRRAWPRTSRVSTSATRPSSSSGPSRRPSTRRGPSMRPAPRPTRRRSPPRPGMTGDVIQAVPAASAVKVDGRRSYARMRAGEAVAAPPRPVTDRRLEIGGFDEATQRATIAVECSKGTYVRQIAADLGEATGAGAYCLELRRTASASSTSRPPDRRPRSRPSRRGRGSWRRWRPFRTFPPASSAPRRPRRRATDAASSCTARPGPVRLATGTGSWASASPETAACARWWCSA